MVASPRRPMATAWRQCLARLLHCGAVWAALAPEAAAQHHHGNRRRHAGSEPHAGRQPHHDAHDRPHKSTSRDPPTVAQVPPNAGVDSAGGGSAEGVAQKSTSPSPPSAPSRRLADAGKTSKDGTEASERSTSKGPSPASSSVGAPASSSAGAPVKAADATAVPPSSVASNDSEKKRLSDQIASQEATISSLHAKVDAMSREKTVLAGEVASKEKEIVGLKSQVKAEEEEVRHLSGELKSENAQVMTLNMKLGNWSEENTKLKEDIRNKVVEIANLKVEVGNLKAQGEENSRQLSAKSDENAKLLGETASQKTKIDTLSTEADKAKAAHAKLKKEHMDLRKSHLKLHAKHDHLESQYADPSVQHFLRAKAIKVYSDPGIEGAANKTFIYVLPTLRERYVKGKQLINASESAVYSKLNAFVGSKETEPWLPAISGCLVYGTIIVPFICTVCCLTRIVCKLRPMLLFCHLDFLLTTLCAGIFAAYTGQEPLAAFAHHDAAVYLFTQVIFAIAYCMYAGLLVCAYCAAKPGTSEGCYRCLQLAGATPVGIIYYVLVWTPAMLDEMPHMEGLVESLVGDGASVSRFAWLPYLPVSFLFLVLLRLERLCWLSAGASGKAGQELKEVISMRDDIELAKIIGEDPDANKQS